MNSKWTVVLALVAGFVGGLLSSSVMPAAHAQITQSGPLITKEVRAESFTLIDSAKRIVGKVTWYTPLRDSDGRFNAVLKDSPEVPERRIVIEGPDNNVLWSAVSK